MKKKKGFTLIELVAVLVILAMLALIVTPLVLNIIRKAKDAANKRSIDAYGRSIELAIASHLLDTGEFPTSISDLTIEYSGDEVVCTTTQLNSDSTVYLAGCTVGGRSTGDYTYGEEEVITYDVYSVGDEVTYNNVDYRVIKDSGATEDTVTLLKAEPLTVAEVNQYGVGHINRYTMSPVGTASNENGYGGMAYYSSSSCGSSDTSGCTTNYAQSEIKYVVDAWKTAKAPAAIEARLITIEELKNNLGYDVQQECTGSCYPVGIKSDNTPAWVYNSSYWYWTMSQYNDSASAVWSVGRDGGLKSSNVNYNCHGVRPVITISKSNLSS